jgi:putative methyltransferase
MMGGMRVVVSQYEGIDATPVLPLAAGCLVSAARVCESLAGSTFDITLVREAVNAAARAVGEADTFGMAIYPWNAAYSLAVAREVRMRNPDCLIIAGGASVPRRPDRARRFLQEHPEVDMLVSGEGEVTFPEVLRARQNGNDFAHIAGVAYRGADGVVRFTEPPKRVLEFSATASPFLDGTFDELIGRHRSRFAMALLETNRGCPFSCTFCDWSLTKKVVEFPLERVASELEWVARHGFSHIMLADANFGIRPRDAGIARAVAGSKRRTGLPKTFYFYLTKNNHGRNLETIEILQEASIGTWVGLAVQDFDDDVLEAVKRDNIQTGEAVKLRAICGERGIPTFHELILGLPGQTYTSFLKTLAASMPPLPRHDFVLFLCRLIENAELGSAESRERFGIQTRRCLWKTSTPGWEPVVDEYQEVVVGTRDMPVEAWRRTFRISFLASSLYNLRLMRVVLQHVVDAAACDLADYLHLLAEHMEAAPPDSVYAALFHTLDRYAVTLLAGGPFVLPTEDAGTPVTAEDAAARVALSRYSEFLDETEQITARMVRTPALREAFRYQRLITPRWQHPYAIEEEFEFDWPAYTAGGPLRSGPVRIRYTPAPAPFPDFASFATAHFAVIRTRLEPGQVEVIGRKSDPRIEPSDPPRLVILPATG